MDRLNQIKLILYSSLQIDEEHMPINAETPLLGSIPQFDSFAVVSLITAMEDSFGFIVEDEEIDATVFETVGSLLRFIETKLE
jgi:acyl carrier protein